MIDPSKFWQSAPSYSIVSHEKKLKIELGNYKNINKHSLVTYCIGEIAHLSHGALLLPMVSSTGV